MIKIVAKMTVRAEKLEEFKALAKEMVEKSSAEEGNISYTLNQAIDNPCSMAFIEVWKDQTAIDIHNASEHFNRILPQTGALCEGEGEVTLFTEVS